MSEFVHPMIPAARELGAMIEQGSLLPESAGRHRVGEHWFLSRDGDPAARRLFSRHYSRRLNWDSPLFVGPGEKLVLITGDGRALFAWRRYIDDGGQSGVNCAVFHNEGETLSSELILDAERIAWDRWPGERLFTFINPGMVRSTNPGACFIIAGWARLDRRTKRRELVILEKFPA